MTSPEHSAASEPESAVVSQTIGRCRIQLDRADFAIDVDFGIPARGVLGLYGPSGSGKTSILRAIAGLEPEARGEIEIEDQTWLDPAGRSTPAHRREIGFVFQDSRLFPHLTVRENVEYGQRRRARPDAPPAAATLEDAVRLLDLGALLERRPEGLSGGERQRVAIARALLARPRLLLLDEPMASVDRERKGEILPYLDRLHEEIRVPMLYVSHAIDEIQSLCDRIVVLEAGRIRFEGELAEALVAPTAGLAGHDDAATLLEGRVAAYDAAAAVSTIDLGDGQRFLASKRLEVGTAVRLRVCARDVSLSLEPATASTILNALPGRIERRVAETAHHVTVVVAVGTQAILARVSRLSAERLALDEGVAVFAQVKAVSVHDVLHAG